MFFRYKEVLKIKYKIVTKQKNSKNCILCGLDNPFGLKAVFYELADGQVCSVCTTREDHQSYPNRHHGGMTAAILDETIGRAAMPKYPDQWAVTAELQIRYLKPLPLEVEVKTLARVDRDTRLLYEGSGEIYLPDGSIAATARGKYLKMSLDQLNAGEDFLDEEWIFDESSPIPDELEIKGEQHGQK